MWVIGLIGVLLIFLVANMSSKIGKNKHSFTDNELESMSKEMCGKSQEECRRILKKYVKNAKTKQKDDNYGTL